MSNKPKDPKPDLAEELRRRDKTPWNAMQKSSQIAERSNKSKIRVFVYDNRIANSE